MHGRRYGRGGKVGRTKAGEMFSVFAGRNVTWIKAPTYKPPALYRD